TRCRRSRGDSRLSWLLTPHPLQVHAGRNQLQPLLVTMPHGELLRAWRWNSTSGAAPHAVRAWRCALLHLQVRELSDEASIFAVLCLKPLNLFLTLLPVHSFFFGGLVQFPRLDRALRRWCDVQSRMVQPTAPRSVCASPLP